MKERNRHILKKAISKMPAFSAHEKAWESLKNELDSGYRKSIENLPRYQAPAGTWERIETRLDRKSQPAIIHRPWVRSAAAAVIMLVIGTTLVYLVNRHPGGLKNKMQTESGLDNPLIYNPALCKGNPQVCNSPVFLELDKQLAEVKKELDLMKTLIENQDPQLLKYYYRLENLRVEIEKRMVKLIMES